MKAEEIKEAAFWLGGLAMYARGDDWKLATERVGDEQEERIVGIDNGHGELVLGDLMNHLDNQEVCPDDARLIATMDPKVAYLTHQLLVAGAEMAQEYPELAEDHDRDACDDYACSLMGAVVGLTEELLRKKAQVQA